MNSVGSSLLGYLFAHPKELCDNPRTWSPYRLALCRAKLEDPDYIRHDPYHAALAKKDIRLLDQLTDLRCTMYMYKEKETEVRVLDNKIAEAVLRIFENHEKIFDAQLRERALLDKSE